MDDKKTYDRNFNFTRNFSHQPVTRRQSPYPKSNGIIIAVLLIELMRNPTNIK